jgi:chromate transport protein ChrA
VLAGLGAVFAYLALAPRPRRFVAGSFAAGVVLNIGALIAALLIFAANGSCSDNGDVDAWMWGLGIAVVAACAAWALQRPRHTWWGLPAATILAAIVVTLVASIVNGSTGVCLD